MLLHLQEGVSVDQSVATLLKMQCDWYVFHLAQLLQSWHGELENCEIKVEFCRQLK